MRHRKAVETQMRIYLQVVQDDTRTEQIIINANEMRQFRIQHNTYPFFPQSQGLFL